MPASWCRGNWGVILLQRMLRLRNHVTAEEMLDNVVHFEQFK